MASNSPIEYDFYLSRYTWPTDGNLTSTSPMGLGGPDIYSKEGQLHNPQSSSFTSSFFGGSVAGCILSVF